MKNFTVNRSLRFAHCSSCYHIERQTRNQSPAKYYCDLHGSSRLMQEVFEVSASDPACPMYRKF